jgi:hypothetical protein
VLKIRKIDEGQQVGKKMKMEVQRKRKAADKDEGKGKVDEVKKEREGTPRVVSSDEVWDGTMLASPNSLRRSGRDVTRLSR